MPQANASLFVSFSRSGKGGWVVVSLSLSSLSLSLSLFLFALCPSIVQVRAGSRSIVKVRTKALDGPRPQTDQGPRRTKALDGPKP